MASGEPSCRDLQAGRILGSCMVSCVGAFVFGTSFVVWYALKLIMGLRVSEEEEFSGMDMPKFGLAVPEFVQKTGYDYGSGNSEKAQELFRLGNWPPNLKSHPQGRPVCPGRRTFPPPNQPHLF